MLNLETMAVEDARRLVDALRKKFDTEKKAVSEITAHMPRGDVTPAYLQVLADAAAVLVEGCDAVGRMERRWASVADGFASRHRECERIKGIAERAAQQAHLKELQDLKLKTGDERRDWLAQFLVKEAEDEAAFRGWLEEVRGWHAQAKRHYQHLRDQCSTLTVLTEITRQALWVKGLRSPEPDGIPRGHSPSLNTPNPMLSQPPPDGEADPAGTGEDDVPF